MDTGGMTRHRFFCTEIKPMTGFLDWWSLDLENQQNAARRQFKALQELMSPAELDFGDVLAWHHVAGQLHLDAILMRANQYCRQKHLLVFARQLHEFRPFADEATQAYADMHVVKQGKFDLFVGAYPVEDSDMDGVQALLTLDAVGAQVYSGLAGLLATSLRMRIAVDNSFTPPPPQQQQQQEDTPCS